MIINSTSVVARLINLPDNEIVRIVGPERIKVGVVLVAMGEYSIDEATTAAANRLLYGDVLDIAIREGLDKGSEDATARAGLTFTYDWLRNFISTESERLLGLTYSVIFSDGDKPVRISSINGQPLNLEDAVKINGVLDDFVSMVFSEGEEIVGRVPGSDLAAHESVSRLLGSKK